jgi:hypothetical protein
MEWSLGERLLWDGGTFPPISILFLLLHLLFLTWRQMLNYIGSNTIICSGVSVGSIDTVLPYLDQVKSLIEGKTIIPYITTNHFPTCERNGVDQGLHNVLVYTKQIQNLRIWSQADSPVLNLQAKVARVDGMKVSNMKGMVVPVVHQYDRYPDLQKLLFKEVSGKRTLSSSLLTPFPSLLLIVCRLGGYIQSNGRVE